MRGNWINCTHNGAGGTGPLTLVDAAGWPGYDNVFTGTVVVDYEILEYTDSTKTVLLQAEAGIGSINTSTLVLARTKITASWTSSVYLPNPRSASAPSAVNFGNKVASISIVCAPSAVTHAGVIPFKLGAIPGVNDGIGLPGTNILFVSNITAFTPVSGTIYYIPTKIEHHGPFSQAAIRLGATAATTGTPTPPQINVAIFEIGSDGNPGKKLIDFGIVGSPTTTNVTYQSSPIAVPVDLVPGWYWVGFLYLVNNGSGAPGVAQGAISGALAVAMATTTHTCFCLTLSGQAGFTDPAIAPTGATTNLNNSSPLVCFA